MSNEAVVNRVWHEIGLKRDQLEEARAEWDRIDVNSATEQIVASQRVSTLATELKALETLYKKLTEAK